MAVTDERVSRRRLLKRAGLGAAAFGAGSMLTAQSATAVPHHGDQACIDAGGCGVCGGQLECGGFGCYCITTVDSCCFCAFGFVTCASLQPCHHSSDCPPGWACLRSCCDQFGFGPLCVPPCSFGENAIAATEGPMVSGGGGSSSAEPEPEAPKHGHGGPKHG
jgi:hypothetical protein